MLFAIKMQEKNISNIVILDLTPELAINLKKYSNDLDSNLFKQGLSYNLLKFIHYFPYSNKIVAFDKKKGLSIGFLSIKKNGDFSLIEDIFVDENYRNMGVASKLINYATELATKKGAKKVSLNVYNTNINAINLYKKLDFEEIGNSIMGQGNLLGSTPLRLMQRLFIGHGFLSKISLINNDLSDLNLKSRKIRERIFEISLNCMPAKWIDFFEINTDKLKDGAKREWQPSVYTNILTNHFFNSYIIVFGYPFSYKATVELYSNSDVITYQILDNLVKYLGCRGISFVRITSFNLSHKVEEWYKQKEMMIFHFLTMGKKLK
jgi:GNAT superfamily N-acetyltransferase